MFNRRDLRLHTAKVRWHCPRSTAFLLGFLFLCRVPAPAHGCALDCDGDGHASAAEVVAALQSDCPRADVDRDRFIDDDEVASAISSLFSDCYLPAPPNAGWESAFDTSEIGWIMSGWGTGDGSLWVVGGTVTIGAVIRRDATGWHEVDLGVRVPLMHWVHGTSAHDIFVGGRDGKMLHYDGYGWSLQPTPTTAPIWGIWAAASDDVWAVGGNSALGGPAFIIHYDGVSWALVDLPALVRPGVFAFFKIWGAAADDLYSVGQNGAILHWNGGRLIEQGAGISQDLIGIWGNAADDITTVGGRGTAEIAHYDGTRWRKAAPSSLPGLNGVWTRRPDVAHAVGVAGTVVRLDPRTPEVTAIEPVPTTLELHSVFGDASGQLVAMGANFQFPEEGIILTRRLEDDD